MQKLKYYTVCLTLCFIGVFLSYPNISLSQSYNIEEARRACEKYGGIYIEVEDVGRYNQCILDSTYDSDILAEDCAKIGGTFDFEEGKCQIEPLIDISLERYCISANGQWRNESCVFDISIACVAANGQWDEENGICDFSSRETEKDFQFFTDELRKEIEQGTQYEEGLHKVIFHVEESFYVSIAESTEDQFGEYDRRTFTEKTYGVIANIPGICLHLSAQRGEDWTSSQGPCVDPSGNPITLEEQETMETDGETMETDGETMETDEETMETDGETMETDGETMPSLTEQVPQETSDSIWIIFSEDDSHGFKFTRSEEAEYYEGAWVHFYYLETTAILPSEVEDANLRYEVQWRSEEENSSYTFTDEEGNPITPSRIRLRYDPTSLKEFDVEEKDRTELGGVSP